MVRVYNFGIHVSSVSIDCIKNPSKIFSQTLNDLNKFCIALFQICIILTNTILKKTIKSNFCFVKHDIFFQWL